MICYFVRKVEVAELAPARASAGLSRWSVGLIQLMVHRMSVDIVLPHAHVCQNHQVIEPAGDGEAGDWATWALSNMSRSSFSHSVKHVR